MMTLVLSNCEGRLAFPCRDVWPSASREKHPTRLDVPKLGCEHQGRRICVTSRHVDVGLRSDEQLDARHEASLSSEVQRSISFWIAGLRGFSSLQRLLQE